jgi:hypothetical protein
VKLYTPQPAQGRRPFDNRRPLDPRSCPIAIDANALDRDGSNRDDLVDRLLKLWQDGKINLIVPKEVRKEIQNPRTPGRVQAAMASMNFTMPVGLNSDEQRRKYLITQELQGNAQPGKHAADADHLFEATKYCGYFITHDQRLLDKASKLRSLLPPSLTVVTLAEFLDLFDAYDGPMGVPHLRKKS